MKKASLFIITFSLLLLFASPLVQAQFVENPQGATIAANGKTDAFDTVVTITNFIFALAFIASIFGFLTSFMFFITAGGSETKLAKGHKAWQASLIGLSVALIGYILVSVIKNFFR